MDEAIIIPTLCENEELLPTYGSQEAAGADVRAAIEEDVILNPGERFLVPTGIRVAIPQGYEIQIRPRSGLAIKEGITVLNSPGTVDADYRGEIGIILINHGKKPFEIKPKMRLAQMVLTSVIRAVFVSEKALSTTTRGEDGFGHTGTL